MAESAPWYSLIRHSVRSKDLENPFVLKLLYNTLRSYMESTNIDTKESEPVENQLEEMDSKELKIKQEFEEAGTEEFSEIGKNHSEVEVSGDEKGTVIFDDDEFTETYNLPIKSEENEKEDQEVSNYDSNSSTEDFYESHTDVEYKTEENLQEKNENERVERTKKCLSKEKEDESELEKLLRMASAEPSVSKKSLPEEKEVQLVDENVNKNQNADNKSTEDKSLLDFLSEKEETSEDLVSKTENYFNNFDYETILNSETKKTFLLTSSDESDSIDENIIEEKKTKTKSKKKEKQSSQKTNKKDDLEKFTINLNSGEKTKEKKGDDSSVDIILGSSSSDESEFNYSKVKRKRCSEESDSSVEIQQVVVNKKSPTKSRKNIKKILNKTQLQEETIVATKREAERKKRLKERQKLFNQFFPQNNCFSSKLVLDFDPKTGKELVVVHEDLAARLKPHQREGVQFMWNNCFESCARTKETPGTGCILGHCMGLGKTLQVVTLLHTILRHDLGLKTVMIMCPLNTVRNWNYEFDHWLQKLPNRIRPFIIASKIKNRIRKIRKWSSQGGVLIVGYGMFRALMHSKDEKIRNLAFEYFLDPGPDLVVCDEGHLLKNDNSSLSKYLSHMRTLRRIVLTGTPMQNNLLEYYCMVQFVKPHVLGTRVEFMNRFMNPISNGQFEDSTEADVRLMKRRAHVLHTMLDGFVQRFTYSVLTKFLPEKQEYVISISLTDTQIKVYQNLVDSLKTKCKGLFKYSSWMHKIYTHPLMMLRYSEKEKETDISEMKKVNWEKFINKEEYETCKSSGKLLLLFQILQKCKEVGDKVLVFSQFLESLDLIEYFLDKAHKAYETGNGGFEYPDEWRLGKDYFRMDGSTSSENRDTFCHCFNDTENKRSRLFLISTRAGGLGINLVAANRVILFDASWNPSHDLQSIFRIYRFGQTKICYVYRFLASATLEEKIYKRQVTKLSLAYRILDEHQIERHYTSGNIQELYDFAPIPRNQWKLPKIPKDRLLAEILNNNRDTIVGYHEHDSLLENKEEEELSEEERRAAWEEYEKEKLEPRPQQLVNNHTQINSNHFEMLNYKILETVTAYKTGIPGGTNTNTNLVYNNADEPLCKIANVRTLNEEHRFDKPRLEQNVVEIGSSLGLPPVTGESYDQYCQRITQVLKKVSDKSNLTNGH